MPSRKVRKSSRPPSRPQKLWAPWRLSYILDPQDGPLSKKATTTCVFCDHQAARNPEQDRADLILSRGKSVYTILNKYPYSYGHLMVIPYEHLGSFPQMPAHTAQEIILETQRATRLLEKTLKADGFNIGMNLGRLAGAGIPDHVHIHVVPRWQGDHNFMPVLAETRVLPEHIETTYDRLVEAFRK